MSAFEQFWHMGGYAFYVWSTYGLAAVVLAANVLGPWLRAREVLRRLTRQTQLERDHP